MLNQVTLLGNLGQTPEVKTSEGGTTFTRFLLATNQRWTKDGKKHERTDWHPIVVFGRLAEAMKMLTKGDKVVVRGELRGDFREVEGGRSELQIEVHAQRIDFLKVAAWKDRDPLSAGTEGEHEPEPGDEDIPF